MTHYTFCAELLSRCLFVSWGQGERISSPICDGSTNLRTRLGPVAEEHGRVVAVSR